MKKIIIALSLLSFIALAIIGCEDYSKITAPAFSTGTADFTRFVSIGNSLTMGEQSSSVFEAGQMYSFGNIIAKQLGTTYAQATFSDPGTGGRLEIQNFEIENGSLVPVIVENENMGSPTNLTYPAPYNNLGVKGAFLWDVLNARSASTCYTANFGVPNPLFDAVLRGLGTQLELTIAQQPTFVTLWIGNNDILAFATRGGLFPITPIQQFSDNYNTILNALSTTGANIVLGNIPNVKFASFFRTVGPAVGVKLEANQVPGMVYATSTGVGSATVDDLFSFNVLILLTGSSAAAFIGDQTGAYYTLNNITVPPGVDVNYPFGLAPQNPFPNELVLDPNEITAVDMTIAAYNNYIETTAANLGLAYMDADALIQAIGTTGKEYNGINYTAEFIQGGFYSLDGIHPTSQGYGIVANEFIKVINQKFGASIPLVDVSTIPGSLVFTGTVSMDKYGIPNIPYGSLEHIIF